MERIKSAAVLTIKNVSKMSARGRGDIVNWLRHQARMFLKQGDEYSDNFRARYLFRSKEG